MKISKLLSAVLAVCLLAGCAEKETQVEVSSVSLNTSTIEMVEGETFNLIATVSPNDAVYDKVIWASSNASVASVNQGTVTALKQGTSTITASAGGKSATCTVKVSAKVIAVTSVTLDKTSLSMKIGDSETLTATVNPADATDKTITWMSSDVSVVTVSDGKLTAKDSGTATITAKAGNCTADCTVTVSVDVESVSLDITTLSLIVGESATLTATVKPDNATDKNVVWASSDNSVATVSNGKVTAVNAGTATVKATCGGKTAECAVNVTVPTGSITLDKTVLSLAVGESATLTATVKPDNATDKNVVWTSSDNTVVTVSDGKVTAVKAGTATVNATCGGKTAECAVTVTDILASSITLNKTALSLDVGQSATLTATVKPENATYKKSVKWTSSNNAVATVANGTVTAVSAGQVRIDAYCPNATTYCVVTVTVPISSITLDKTELSMEVGETATLIATVKPDNATDKNVVWTSSDKTVATVLNGKVAAKKAGTATIKATCGSKTAECVVTVTATPLISYTTVNGAKVQLVAGYDDKGNLISQTHELNNGVWEIYFNSKVDKISFFTSEDNLKTIKVNKSIVVSTLFMSSSNLEIFDLSLCDIVIGNFQFDFQLRCPKITSFKVNSLYTETLAIVFLNCAQLQNIDVSNWNTSKVTSMRSLFVNCSRLSSLDLSSWDTSNLVDLAYMFGGCTNLEKLDLSGWKINTSAETKDMFYDCNSLKYIYMRGCDAETISIINSVKPTNAVIITK
jgi:surface protein